MSLRAVFNTVIIERLDEPAPVPDAVAARDLPRRPARGRVVAAGRETEKAIRGARVVYYVPGRDNEYEFDYHGETLVVITDEIVMAVEGDYDDEDDDEDEDFEGDDD